MKQLIVLTGMHRSGTTFPGKIMNTIGEVLQIHEPFNPLFGCEGVDTVYPFAGETRDKAAPALEKIVGDLLRLKCKYKAQASSDTFLKGISRRLVGGRGGISLLQARLKSLLLSKDRASILVKDPFAFLMTPFLVKRHDAKVIIMVRHPVAVWNSIKRMEWKFSFSNFASPDFFQLDENRGCDVELLDRMDDVRKIANLWVILYRQALLYASRYGRNVLLVRHEDLCVDAVSVMRVMTQFAQLLPPPDFSEQIRKFTEHGKVNAQQGKLHDFRRNSRELAWSWTRREHAAEENELRHLAGELVNELYGQWRPNTEDCQ